MSTKMHAEMLGYAFVWEVDGARPDRSNTCLGLASHRMLDGNQLKELPSETCELSQLQTL